MSTEITAAKELLTFIERVERLEDVRKDAADDIAEVYKDLASRGFDKVAAKVIVKIRRADDGLEKWTGTSETVDFYLSALGMLPPVIEARAPAHARVENIDKYPAHDAETGEILTQEQPETTTTIPASQPKEVTGGNLSIPSTDAGGEERAADADHIHAQSEQVAQPIPHSPAVLLPGKADKTSEAVVPPASSLVAIPDDDVPAFLRKDVPADVTSPEFIKLLRPFCQNLDDCHGHGRECSKCKAVRAA